MYVKKTLLERDKVYFSNLYDSKKKIIIDRNFSNLYLKNN